MGGVSQGSSQKKIASRQWTQPQTAMGSTDLAAGLQEQEEDGDEAERAGLAGG